MNRGNPIALTAMATAYMLLGDHSAAYEHAQRAVRSNPSFAFSYLCLAGAQVHCGDYQQGEITILKAFELSPTDPELTNFFHAKSEACLGQGKYEEALEAIEQALFRNPDAGALLGIRATVLGHLGQTAEAKAALDRYLTLRPDLKTRAQYRRISIPNSALADLMVEGLVKAGWEPDE